MQTQANAVVLLSGGLDSSVCLAIAKKRHANVLALSFMYGQTHETAEIACAEIQAAQNANHHIILPLPLSGLRSALTGQIQGDIDPNSAIPNTYVPHRNMIFLSVAFGVAESVGATHIYIGANAVDYSGYPDCRPQFMAQMQLAAQAGSKSYADGLPAIEIVTPILYATKKRIVEMARELGVSIEDTLSCYHPTQIDGKWLPCRACDSCRIRNSALLS